VASLSIRPLSRRFRLHTGTFPRVRPRDAPCGFVDEVGWLASGVLCIGGWLTLEPAATLETELALGDTTLRRQATCFTGPAWFEAEGKAARRWILLVPVGEEYATISRVRRITLGTPLGDLQWIGGFDRLISPDLCRYLQGLPLSSNHLVRLASFLDEFVHVEGLDRHDPTLQWNLAALRHSITGGGNPRSRPVGDLKTQIRRAMILGEPPAHPESSILVTLIRPPDLLEHRFAQFQQIQGIRSSEVLLIVGRSCEAPNFADRVEALTDLYRLPVKLLLLKGDPSWAVAATLGARRAESEILVFLQGQTLGLEPSGLTSLVEPLHKDPATGITTPIVRHFDGSIRSGGLRVVPGSDGSISLRPETVEREQQELGDQPGRTLDACAADCFAIHRRLFDDLRGFANLFERPDLEAVDLCLRARDRGYSVLRVPTSVIRFVEASGPPPLPRPMDSDRSDFYFLSRRHRHLGVGSGQDRVAGAAGKEEGSSPFLPNPPAATVVIPTLEPGAELAEVLDRLESQEKVPAFEILVIDSDSKDGTLDLLRQRGIRHCVIRREEFNHGLTRNLGVQQARGGIVAFLSQDALPSPDWLAGLLDAFQDPRVAGAYSRQIPRPDASPWVLHQLASWPASRSEARRQEIPPPHVFGGLSLEERLATVCFDNVSSALRRSVALRIPFRDLPFGEDRDWAYRVLLVGYAIEYRPDASVIHSHDRSAWYELRRTFLDHRLIGELLGAGESPSIWSLGATAHRETRRLLNIASSASTRRKRFQATIAAPARAWAATAGAHLAVRASHQVPSGSRRWRWLSRRLTKGV
jgi:rhamnosyltransferase